MEVMLGAGIVSTVIIGAVIVIGLIAVLVVVPSLAFRAMELSLRRRIAATYVPDQIVLEDLKAVTLGLESRGVMQGRGNGALVLTANELGWFRFVAPKGGDLRISRETITTVDTVKAHLGKIVRAGFAPRDVHERRQAGLDGLARDGPRACGSRSSARPPKDVAVVGHGADVDALRLDEYRLFGPSAVGRSSTGWCGR